MAFSRRKFLLGLGGVAVGLPFFEGLAEKDAKAAQGLPPFALFYRRGNGVQQAVYDRNSWLPDSGWYKHSANQEKERWWPMEDDGVTAIPFGALRLGNVSAMSALSAFTSRMTVIKGLRHPYGTENGHPEGAVQGLTGAGVKYLDTKDTPDIAGCYPLGESLDNRIASELSNGAQKTSLYMGYATQGDHFISWQKAGTSSLVARTCIEDPRAIFASLFSGVTGDQATQNALLAQSKSVNDLVRDDINRLKNDPRMSKNDLNLLDLHLSGIRDLEIATGACDVTKVTQLGTDVNTWTSSAMITETINLFARLAALAIQCGVRQSVLVNIGLHQDVTQYYEVAPIPTVGQYPFHAISHRLTADASGAPSLAAGSDYHNSIDIYHLKQFLTMLTELDKYPGGVDGQTLLDRGVSVHFSDLGSGQHINSLLPYLYVGSAGGTLKTGQYVNKDKEFLVKFLNTIGAAVGCKNASGGPLDDFNSVNGILPPGSTDSDGGLTPVNGGVRPNNNYLTRNYSNTYYWQNPTANYTYAAPADGKAPITGKFDDLLML